MPELRQLVDGLALGLDALVRSYWGSEASAFTHDVVRELERRGYEVIHILGTTRRGITQFGALRFSIEDLFRGSSDPITVVDRLSSRILESARPVLVIENADLVDPLSLEVIHDAVERTGCRQVIVLSEVPTADTSALVRPPVQVITLAPPSYSVIEDLVRSSATSGVSDAWIRRAFVDSGGAPEIVTAILSDPATDNDDTALRTDSVLAVVGSRLSEIPAPLVASLRGIALSPGLTLHEGIERFGPQSLEPLERAGLVTVSRDEGAVVLSCPPLIAAYFATASGRIGAPFDTATPALDRPRDVQQLVRSLETEARDELAAAQQRFSESDTPQTRAELAQALWLTDATESALEGVLDDPHGDLDLLVTRATWFAVRGRVAEALPLLAPAAERSGALGALAAAESLLLEVEYDRVPEDLAERIGVWAPDPAATPDDLGTVLALCCTYAGLLDDAEALLPADPPRSPRQRCRWYLVRGVLTLTRAPLAEAEAAANDGLALAVDAHDRSGIETFAYLVAMARLLRGDWSGAGSLLAGVRALGHACLFTWPLHRALRATHAIVLAAEGKETVARALATECATMVGSTPLAGMTAPIDELVTAVLRRDVSGVAGSFARMADEARDRGYALADVLGTAAAVALEPARALEMNLTRERPSWAGWPTFVALVGALTAGDAVSASQQVGALPADAFQFLGFLTVNSALSRLDPDAITGDLRIAADALAARTGAGNAFRPGSGRFGDRISDREREVALLAATLSNAEIARRLGVSKRTIDHHISNALRKTGARTRIELNALVREASVRGPESTRADLPR
jgi:DNA-binding CsgD family transcriptional regulator